MATNNAEVSSQALRGLQDNLNSLSEQIRGICDTLNSDRDRVGEAWRDSKFQEFKQGFQPQIDRCSEISVRYHDWCIKILDPAISQVEKIEQADVVGNGSGSVGGGGAAGAAVGSSAATAATGKGNMFNMSGGMKQTPQSDNQSTVKKIFAEADEACQLDNRSDKFRAKLAKQGDKADFTIASKTSSTGDNFTVGGKVGGKVEMPVFKVAKASASIEGEGKYNSGVETTETTGTYAFKCVEDNTNK